MITNYECIPCGINSILNMFELGLIENRYKEPIIKSTLKYLAEIDYNDTPIRVNRNKHRLIRKISGNSDPYKPLKEKFNTEALKLYPEYKQIVDSDKNPFNKALRLAIAGNIIDFGPGHTINIKQTIEEIFKSNLAVDHSKELFDEIKKAKSILYLLDNTGEVVFDKIFIETVNHPNITVVVRNSPILNDATMEDAKLLELDKLATIITNGDDSPGTLLSDVSEEFMEKFNNADLIISKGMGNFEGLSGVKDKNIFFLLVAKCNIVANILGTKKGGYIVKSALK